MQEKRKLFHFNGISQNTNKIMKIMHPIDHEKCNS